MEPAIYTLGAITCLACALLLLRGYRRGGKRLLLWSGVCFAGLTLSNLFILVDLVILPDVDLYLWRLSIAAASMLILLYGLIWESD